MTFPYDLWHEYVISGSLDELRNGLSNHLYLLKCNPTLLGDIIIQSLLGKDVCAADIFFEFIQNLGLTIDDAFSFGAIIELLDGWCALVYLQSPKSQTQFSTGEPILGLKWLFEKNASIIRRMGALPLQYAAANEMNKSIPVLIENGASVDSIDFFDDNNTALIEAIEFSNIETVRVLLSYDANPYIENIYGDNAFDIAKKIGDKEIIDALHRKR